MYLIIGLFWSIFKWRKYAKSQILYLREKLHYSKATIADMLALSENKERITTWIVYWPFNALQWIIKDMVMDLIHGIINKMSWAYESITKSLLKDIKDEPTEQH